MNTLTISSQTNYLWHPQKKYTKERRPPSLIQQEAQKDNMIHKKNQISLYIGYL
jgi:hypothetical protein